MIFYIWQRKFLKWQIGKKYALSKHFNFKQKLKSSREIHCVAPMINKTLCLTTCSWNMTQSGMNTTLSSSLCPGSVDFEQDELGLHQSILHPYFWYAILSSSVCAKAGHFCISYYILGGSLNCSWESL